MTKRDEEQSIDALTAVLDENARQTQWRVNFVRVIGILATVALVVGMIAVWSAFEANHNAGQIRRDTAITTSTARTVTFRLCVRQDEVRAELQLGVSPTLKLVRQTRTPIVDCSVDLQADGGSIPTPHALTHVQQDQYIRYFATHSVPPLVRDRIVYDRTERLVSIP